MSSLFPWSTGDLDPDSFRTLIVSIYFAIVAAVLNAINLAIYTATIVFVTAELWKSIG